MGRKVHPIGFRLSVTQDWQGRWFAEGAQYREYLRQDFAIRDLIRRGAARHPDRAQGRGREEDPRGPGDAGW
jgi:hypothetical protein